MGPLDFLVLILTGVTAAEAVIELRRKRWGAAAISIAVLVLLVWFGAGIYVYLWKSITGSS